MKQVISAYILEDVTPRGKRSPTTTQRYWGLLENITPLHLRRVDDLDGAMIETFYLDLLKRGLSHTTVRHIHNLMFTSFRWGSTRRISLVARNPFEYDDIPKPRRSKSGAASLTKEQARNALESIAESKHCNAIIFSLASACRRGETFGLKWDAIDLEDQIAIIRESRFQVKGFVGQKCVKEERIRGIPLNETAVQALQAERARQDRWRRIAGDAWIESGFVFTDEVGAPLSPMRLTNAFYRVARRARLPTTRLHDLRHTAATFILSAGGNPVAATRSLGIPRRARPWGCTGT